MANLLDKNDLAHFLRRLSHGDDAVDKILQQTLPKVLWNKSLNDAETAAKVNRVVEWAQAAAATNKRWISGLDQDGMIARLSKIDSLDALWAMANADMEKKSNLKKKNSERTDLKNTEAQAQRKIINEGELTAFVGELSNGDKKVEALLQEALPRVLKKESVGMVKVGASSETPLLFRFDADAARQDASYMGKVNHIVDWVLGAVVRDAEWTKQRDAHGKLLRLNKADSLDALWHIADADIQEQIRRELAENGDRFIGTKTQEEIDKGFIKTVASVPESGLTWVRLLTKEALKREGTLMGHCIGSGGYDRKLEDEKKAYYSLRDAENQPHVTIEVDDGKIVQCQGKENKAPVGKYTRLISSFIMTNGWSVPDNMDISHCGVAMGRENSDEPYRLLSIYELPERAEIKGNLDASFLKLERLPRDFKIHGKLFISKTLPVMPEKLEATVISFSEVPSMKLDENMQANQIELNRVKNVEIGKGKFGSIRSSTCGDVSVMDGAHISSLHLNVTSKVSFHGNSTVGDLEVWKVDQPLKLNEGIEYAKIYQCPFVEVSNPKQIDLLRLSSVKEALFDEGVTFGELDLMGVQSLFVRSPDSGRLKEGVLGKNILCDNLVMTQMPKAEITCGDFSAVRFFDCEKAKFSGATAKDVTFNGVKFASLPRGFHAENLFLKEVQYLDGVVEDPLFQYHDRKNITFDKLTLHTMKDRRICAGTTDSIQLHQCSGLDLQFDKAGDFSAYITNDTTLSDGQITGYLLLENCRNFRLPQKIHAKGMQVESSSDIQMPEELSVVHNKQSSCTFAPRVERPSNVCRPGMLAAPVS